MAPVRTRLDSLDGLRFCAAFFVMIAHITLYRELLHGSLNLGAMSFLKWNVMHLANCGMTLFFVLSGFVIHLNYHKLVRTGEGIKQFALARWSRLYPLFFGVFAIGLAHAAITRGITESLLRPIPIYLTYIDSWWFWPMNHTAGDAAYQEPALGVMWSLSTEAFFYCTYPILAPVISRLKSRQALSAIGLVGGVAALVCLFIVFRRDQIVAWIGPYLPDRNGTKFIQWLGYNSPWVRVFEFLAGAFGAQLFMSGGKVSTKVADGIAIFFVTVVAGVFAAGYYTGSPLSMVDTTLLAPLFAIFFFSITASQQSFFARLLSVRPMILFGESSYSLYLLHVPVLTTLATPALHLYHYGAPLPWAIATIALAIGLARLCYVFYERPAMRFFRKRGAALIGNRITAGSPG